MAKAESSGSSLGAAFRAAIKQVAEPPRISYTARSPLAQYKHLGRTARGQAELTHAGLTAAPQTIRRWLTGRQKPGKANAAKISTAYAVLRRGGIPTSVKHGGMTITGRVGTGRDVRNRGSGGQAPLKINLSAGNWGRIEAAWQQGLFGPLFGEDEEDEEAWGLDDEDLEDMISEDLIEPDIGGSDGWYFPGGGYTVTLNF